MPIDLKELEAVICLMRKHKLDEFASEQFTIKMSKHDVPITYVKMPKMPTDEEVFSSIDQEAVEQWSLQKGGK